MPPLMSGTIFNSIDDVLQIDAVVLNLLGRIRRTERILLAHYFSGMLLAARQPAQYELLCARSFAFVEPQMDTPEAQRLVKKKLDTLLAGLLGPPAWARAWNQRRLDRVRCLFGGTSTCAR